jgi:SET domain
VDAKALPTRYQVWMRTLSSMAWEIDGNPELEENGGIATMAGRHIVGSLLNHSKRRKNCVFVGKDWKSPDLKDRYGVVTQKSMFLQAIRDIFPHEQLLVCYGSQANGFHFIPF